MGGNVSALGKPEKGFGYRVLQVEQNSSGSLAGEYCQFKKGFQVFLDFVLDVKSIKDGLSSDFSKLLNSDEPITLSVYNLYTQTIREIQITKIGQSKDSSLGLTLRKESYVNCQIFRITNVLEQSPSHQGGLKPNIDFVLGLISHEYNTLDEFCKIISDAASRKNPLDLCVFTPSYSSEAKIVKLLPDYKWGGPGALGCEFATGVLHSLKSVIKIEEKPDNSNYQYDMLQEDYQHSEEIKTTDDKNPPKVDAIDESIIGESEKQITQQWAGEDITMDNKVGKEQEIEDQKQIYSPQHLSELVDESKDTNLEKDEDKQIQFVSQDSPLGNDSQGYLFKSPKQDKTYGVDLKLLFQKGFFIENKHVYLY